MTEPIVTLTLTKRQQAIVLDALLDKELESGRYVHSYGVQRPPGPMDSCCTGHRHAYDRRADERASLADRHERVKETITLVKNTEAHSFDNSICRELVDALRDREDDESVRAAEWVADNESDDVVWHLVGKLLDDLTKLATSDAGTSHPDLEEDAR